MGVKASSYKLNIFCKKHSNYRGKRKSKCPSCLLVFIGRWQHDKNAEDRFGGFDPYVYSGLNFEEAFRGIVVREELAPSSLRFTKKSEKMHYPGCPANLSNAERIRNLSPEMRRNVDIGCTCAQASRE